MTAVLSDLLAQSAQLHRHLCPRQVLGVRMGLPAGELLEMDMPQPHKSKRLFTIVETDGCTADGVAVAVNCRVGRRTLRVEDYGKVAATFVDTQNGQAVRIVPRRYARQLARSFAPGARNKWEAMLFGYQRMPALELFLVQPVSLTIQLEKIISHPRKKATCSLCGEEINNEREVWQAGEILCRPCTGQSYYRVQPQDPRQISIIWNKNEKLLQDL